MSFEENDVAGEKQGFAEGWTAFLTEEGLDILLRTSAGESKGRLGELDADGNLVGQMFEPGATEEAKAISLVATRSKNGFVLQCNKRKWDLRQPKGKSHFFAFLNQWPSKAEPVDSIEEMLAALKKKRK